LEARGWRSEGGGRARHRGRTLRYAGAVTGTVSGTYSHRHPFSAPVTRSCRITPPGSPKDTFHHVVSLAGSGLAFKPGDSLGIFPRNHPDLVAAILRRLGARGDEPVPGRYGETVPLGDALTWHFDLCVPSRRLLEACTAAHPDPFARLLEKGHEEELKHYLHAWDDVHDVLDVLDDAPDTTLTPAEFAGAMRMVQPRQYSVASSLLAHPEEAHLLVLSVEYDARSRRRFGICSTFVNGRWPVGEMAPVYVHDAQRHFAMPHDPDAAMIMIGPGTGLAPFRAFLQERDAIGARGRNWLFFGEQSRAWGYYYGEEMDAWEARGLLRLDLAFSRDQPHKIYVQHRMREQARDLYGWLQDGAEVFICGDKGKMAADVQQELLNILQSEGGLSADAAAAYVADMKKTHRLKLDVY
jgi:sulfite reductase (NADPH) flavoprotein alpha-component